VREFALIYMYTMLVTSNSEEGIIPVSELLLIAIVVNDVKDPTEVGMVPSSLFANK